MNNELSALYTIGAANEGCAVPIVNPATGIETGLVIHVLGKDSDEFKRVQNAQNKKRLDRMTKGGFRNPNLTPEEQERDGIELLAACTKSWAFNGNPIIPGPNGEELACNHDNVVLFYKASPATKEQIDTAIGDRANFINA
jgi:hypothetical protein